MGGGLRYFGGAVAFGFAAVWIMASLLAALVCLLSAVVGYGGALVVERMRAGLATRRSRRHTATPRSTVVVASQPPEAMPLWADALNSDLGHIYEPRAATSPLSREADYGWPRDDETVITGGTLQ